MLEKKNLILLGLAANIIFAIIFCPEASPTAVSSAVIRTHVIEINGIYTISVLAENTSDKKITLSLGEGLQADYLLEEIGANKKEKWSDRSKVYSFKKDISIAGRASKVISNFPKVSMEKKHEYNITGFVYIFDEAGVTTIKSAPAAFSIDENGNVKRKGEKKEKSKKADRIKKKKEKPKKAKETLNKTGVFVYEGSGGTEWSTPVAPREGLTLDIPPGSDIDNISEGSEPRTQDSSDSGVSAGGEEKDTDAEEDESDQQTTGQDDSDTSPGVGYIGPGGDGSDEDENEEEPSSDSSDTDDVNTSGGGGGGSGGSIWRNNTYPLLWIPSGNIWYVSDRIGSNSFAGTAEGSSFKTIEHALSRATTHDKILIGPGTYDEGGLNIVKDVHVLGAGGADKTIIKNTTSSSRIITIQADAILEGLTVADHAPSDNQGGGVILSNNCNVQINRCKIINNIGRRGAGIRLTSNCGLAVRDTIIADNLARAVGSGDGRGGAVYLEGNNNIILENVTIADNFAEDNAGGIFILNGTGVSINITDSIVWGNRDSDSLNTKAQSNIRPNAQAEILIDNSCFEGALPSGFARVTNNGGNITNDPDFSNSYERDYRLGFGSDKNLSPCVDSGQLLQIGRNGNEDDMGCFPALVVDSNDLLRTRIDNFGELNADVQMGGSILLLSKQYTELAAAGAINYRLETSQSSGREFNGLLFSGSSTDGVILEGDNLFTSGYQPTISVKNAGVKISDIKFINTKKAINVSNDSGDTFDINIENCLFDLGRTTSDGYNYAAGGVVLTTNSDSASRLLVTLQNNTIIHGTTTGTESIVYIDDADASDALVYVNNIDVMRDGSGYLSGDYNAISLESISQLHRLLSNDTWQSEGLIVDRGDTEMTFSARQAASPATARDNINVDPGFESLSTRDYHLELSSDLVDIGVEKRNVLTFNDSGTDYIDIADTGFIALGLDVGNKVKLVNPEDSLEEFTVISDIEASASGRRRISFRNALEDDYDAADTSFLIYDFSEFRSEPEDNGDTVNIGAYGNTADATKSQ